MLRSLAFGTRLQQVRFVTAAYVLFDVVLPFIAMLLSQIRSVFGPPPPCRPPPRTRCRAHPVLLWGAARRRAARRRAARRCAVRRRATRRRAGPAAVPPAAAAVPVCAARSSCS